MQHVVLLLLLAPSAAAYTVLNNTDFPSNCGGGGAGAYMYSRGTSALDCATQCAQRADCVASVWNSNDGKAGAR